MTSHFVPPVTPNVTPQPGAAPVGMVTELDPVPLLATLYLRVWCDSGPAQIDQDFRLALGATAGARAAETFADLCQTLLATARRPLMRHQTGCRCLGGDEACFAQLITAAAFGAREDALMLAMLMVRPDCAPGIVDLAQQAGLSIHRIILRGPTVLH